MQKKTLLFLALLLPFFSCKKEVFDIDEVKTNCVTGVSTVRKVLFIGIDGCRTDAFLSAGCPSFDSLMAHGYVSLHCDRGPCTQSGPGWSTILHGVYPNKHHVYSNELNYVDYGRYKDVFHYLRESNSGFSLAEVSNWRDFLRITTNEDYAVFVAYDQEVKDKALYLLDNCVPDVLLLHFDMPDHVGHNSGFSPDNSAYIEAIRETGNYVSEIMEKIKSREEAYGEEWMVVVTTDHGGLGKKHNDQYYHDATRYVFEIVRLPNMVHQDVHDASVLNLMPTMLKYMGVNIDSHWDLDGSPLF